MFTTNPETVMEIIVFTLATGTGAALMLLPIVLLLVFTVWLLDKI